MHIPDGFLNTKTWVFFDLLSGAFLILSLERVRNNIGERRVPVLGVVASFIFATQLLNFPIIGGTSGHLIGGALSAILLGPWIGIIIMTTVLVIQCLLFQDGGLTALGANIFNMGILSGLLAYPIFVITRKITRSESGIFFGAFIAGWISVFIASLACACELAVSGTAPLHIVLPAMGSIYSIIGLGEGFITAVVVKLVLQSRPDLMNFENKKEIYKQK